jgi:4,5-DOPA dioxygenase extradiol
MPTPRMPVLFIGHGSPMNIVQKNAYTRSLKAIAVDLPRPEAILVLSAHWLTKGSYVCSAEKPDQIYDFYGFPDELYRVQYHPPGAPAIARVLSRELASIDLQIDKKWGIDHALWAVLMHMYPRADIPVLEMSLDMTKSEEDHYSIGRKLSFLRKEKVLIIGSGNIVHNLHRMEYQEDARPYPWAVEFDRSIKEALLQKDIEQLINYKELSPVGTICAPTSDHYLPMLYSASLQEEDESIEFFHESFQNASISMRCFIIR